MSEQPIWFLDTSSLLSMAVDGDITAAVLDEIGDAPVVIIDVVHDELVHRRSVPATAALATRALAAIRSSWRVLETDRFVTVEQVRLAQADVADGRVLTDDTQHWAESTIIALARRSAQSGSTSIKLLLSEDYDARRVAARVPHMRALSIHGLLHARVQSGRMTPEAAADLAGRLHAAGRGPEVTADDFADPTSRGLGRVASP